MKMEICITNISYYTWYFFLQNVRFQILELEVDLIDSVARFLESRDMVEEALEVSTDPDYRFELAMQLKN